MRAHRLVDAFREDRLLLVATLVMSLVTLLPLTQAAFLPLGDLPDTAACAALLPQIIWGKGAPAEYYSVNWAPVPYWTTTVLIAFFSSISNVLIAVKIVVGLIVLLLPLSTMRMLQALGRDPRLGLLAFGLSWEHSLAAGWIAHGLGMGMALWALAWILEADSLKASLRVAVLGGLIGLTHALPTAYFVVGTAALTLARPGLLRRFVLHATAGVGLVVSLIPWLVERVQSSGGMKSATAMSFEWHPLWDKVRDLFRFTLDNFTLPDDVEASARTFAMLLFAPILLTLLPVRAGATRLASLILLLVAFLFYAGMPMSVYGPVSHWYTYPRFATILVLSLLFVPRPDLRGWYAAWLVPLLLIVAAFDLRVASAFRDWDTRTRPLLGLIRLVPLNSRVLPLELDDTDPAIKWAIGNQMHAYFAAMRNGFDPHLWNNPSIPFQYRQEKRLPSTGPTGAEGRSFTLKQYGSHYDFVLVQGKALDPIVGHTESSKFRARLVGETDRYRLYAIERKAPAASP
ncbi:MAG TPA: hypothetical protein VHP33_08660 [Polyangiaceae bacterium]|nr:hypothetical protein [Polyangiaceae bacterium]